MSRQFQTTPFNPLKNAMFGKLLQALASIVILGSEPREAHDHILLFDDSGNNATVT
jgi:hypothetical protein